MVRIALWSCSPLPTLRHSDQRAHPGCVSGRVGQDTPSSKVEDTPSPIMVCQTRRRSVSQGGERALQRLEPSACDHRRWSTTAPPPPRARMPPPIGPPREPIRWGLVDSTQHHRVAGASPLLLRPTVATLPVGLDSLRPHLLARRSTAPPCMTAAAAPTPSHCYCAVVSRKTPRSRPGSTVVTQKLWGSGWLTRQRRRTGGLPTWRPSSPSPRVPRQPPVLSALGHATQPLVLLTTLPRPPQVASPQTVSRRALYPQPPWLQIPWPPSL